MKNALSILPLLSLLALLALLFPSTLAISSQEICRVQRPKAYQAIDRLCGNTNIRVPSSLATNGAVDSENKAKVQIDGACFPAQWVPLKFCKAQFWNMCAMKARSRRYGRNKCQTWSIVYDGDKVMNVWQWGRKRGSFEEDEEMEEFERFDEGSGKGVRG